jgi:hypothetical protein
VNQLNSTDLTFDSSLQKWVGSYPGGVNSRYLVQIVDGAGNITTSTNKGQYYRPGLVEATDTTGLCTGTCIFLPSIAR